MKLVIIIKTWVRAFLEKEVRLMRWQKETGITLRRTVLTLHFHCAT